MIAVAFLLILVGFALVAPTSTGSGPATPRSVAIGWWRVPPNDPRRNGEPPPSRSRLIQILVGVVMIVGGIVIVAML
jgi:hypothetical protein